MFNKKILATAVAASFTLNAIAAVDLDATGNDPVGTVLYASELLTLTDGNFTAVAGAAADLDVNTTLGFTINEGQVRFIRIDLNNATFVANPTVTVGTQSADVLVDEAIESLATGGAGESFAVIEVTARLAAGLTSGDPVVITGTNYSISGTADATVTYRLYETATFAENPNAASSLALKTSSATLASVVDTVTSEFSTANTLTALVSDGFTTTSADANEDFIARLDFTDLVTTTPTVYSAAGVAADAETILAALETFNLTLNGNLGFGTFTLHSGIANVDCSAAASGTFSSSNGLLTDGAPTPATLDLTANILIDQDGDPLAGSNFVEHVVCVSVDAAENEVFQKGEYTLTVTPTVGDAITDGAGSIVYDTTSIEVPYVTTFEGYNQRIILVNSGPAARYSMTFSTEAGVDAVATNAAQGDIPAEGVLVLRVADLVTLTGGTRAAAVIEIEGQESAIQAATQTVNRSNGGTDTVVLNANSVTAFQAAQAQ